MAIAGKVKAGKSTLLNALVGECVAPTDASECTRVVTCYRNSHVYRVTAMPYVGDPIELRFRRTEQQLEFTLGEHRADEIQYVDVEWPSERLRDVVLIDTPGPGVGVRGRLRSGPSASCRPTRRARATPTPCST